MALRVNRDVMKKLATATLIGLFVLPAALTACSQPNASTGDAPSGSESALTSDLEASSDGAVGEGYVEKVTAELELLDQQIAELQDQAPSVKGINRLLTKQEAARQQLTVLESADAQSLPEAKRQMKRALTQLNRVYERVYERSQQS
jgi:TolA-binding protein